MKQTYYFSHFFSTAHDFCNPLFQTNACRVNRPSRVSALHGKHHSLCLWPTLWCNLDQHQGTLKSLADTCQDHYGHLAKERTVCSVQQEKQRCHRVQKSHQQATNKHNQAKVNWIPINKWRHHLPLCLTAVTWWEWADTHCTATL